MVISSRPKLVLVAVPKTATTSMRSALSHIHEQDRKERLGLSDHATAAEIRSAIGTKEWNESFTAGFVRNPWDRVLSSYSFYRHGRAARRIRSGKDVRLRYRILSRLARMLPFSLWVLLYPGKTCAHFLSDKNGALLVDFVGRFEDLHEDFATLTATVGVGKLILPTLNKSGHREYRDEYGALARVVVALRYRHDIELFGYRF